MENVVNLSNNSPPRPSTFAVSVVIPMYNVDKYVGECLDSLLAQTFQNFDVIVVDDCSTDNSLEIVKNYESKFSGRLTIAQTEKNSGGAGEPRNIGIELSTGEYISFIDPDDTIMLNTLEEMYKAAKKFDADVVHCEKWYGIPDEFYNNAEYRKKAKPTVHPSGEKIFTTKPTLLTNDLEERVKDFCQKRWLTWSVCLQMVRRNFILENKIRFTGIHAEDMVFTMCELCCAKNYLVLPNTFYLYRLREGSSIREDKNLDAPKMIHKYALTLKNGINYLDKFLSVREFFSHRFDLKYILFNAFISETIPRLNKIYNELPAYDIDELLRKELGDNSAFTSFMFNNTYQLQSVKNQKRISVIIPMYNAEKYIGECLDSLLDQTFQDFEVIVVDDCSTDNSVEVVKSYQTRFNGRLKLTKTEKNTGSPGEPGNIGVALSRGEYLFIMDNDDTITPDALEKLYTTAKKFNADVVTCEKFYWVPEESWNDAKFRKNLKPTSYQQGGFVSEPTLVPFDIAQRVQDIYDRKFLWSLWQKLIRRDFLIENDIRFTKNIIQDMVATCCMLYTAQRFVRMPYVINFYRVREDSLWNQKREPLQQLETYLSSLRFGFKYLDEFLSKREFFKKNPSIKRIALSIYLREIWEMYVRDVYHEVPALDRNKVLREIFTDDDQTILMEFFFYALGDFSKINAQMQIIRKFSPYFTARLDIKLQSTEGDFQILSMSDNQAEVLKPAWLQKGGVGYKIQSYAGKMAFVAKATADGKINLNLRGLDIRDPKDNSKRIPYWIDYTKLTINGKVIFDKLTPAWHDKAYFHRIDAKAEEEIKIQVEWLPHIGDTDKDISTESKIDQNKFTPMPLTENLKAISVIIPMYNAEKYIAEGLDSLLMQTFKDFEVIVVDDCSTDNSAKIVQSYVEKFGGRLKLASMEKNSGSDALPRNFGLSLARGEYILFLDADDFISGNALETLYNAAKKYDAEVVYSSSYYNLKQPNDIYLQRDGRGIKLFKENLEDKPDFIVDDPNKLLRTLLMEEPGGNSYNTWTKFCRRNFLIENNIYFLYLKIASDFIWVINVYCHAKRFLRISTPFYFYRSYNAQSISNLKSSTSSEQISRWISSFVAWSQSLKELENSNEILSKNPAYCLVASKNHFGWCLWSIREEMDQLSDQEIYEILRREFSKRNDLSDSTTPFFMSLIYADRKNHERDTKELREAMNRFTGRVDFKFWSTEGDFQLLSVSDDKAEVLKPDWFQKDGVGYVIMSYAGKVEFVAKATANGRVRFELRGIWVQDPKNKPKLIPYWIDYTKLTINGKTIFDKITPAWHDQPYVYTMDAKADEEIKVQFEWLPHRGDILPDKIVEKPPVDKFPPYVTSRMDVKLQSTAGDFQILSMSDDNASVQKPTWLQKNGIGYQIQSYAGKMEFIAKATAGGKINLNLLGMDVRDPKDNSKRVPNWIDYTKLTINGKSIIDKITPAWHDKPYNHSVDAKAGEEIKIQVEWLPHRGDILPDKTVEKPPVDKFPPYVTSRMDVKLQSTAGDFQILSMSDDKAEVLKPAWLQKGGVGYQIQSYAGKMEFVAKATADGKINLALRGLDVHEPGDNSKRIPYWIDYTKLTVNGKTIINKITPAWHDKPYNHSVDAKADEEIKIQVEWLPHRSDT